MHELQRGRDLALVLGGLDDLDGKSKFSMIYGRELHFLA